MSNPLLAQNSARQNGLYQLVLSATFACCDRLKILVCDTQIRVPQVVTNRELVLAHFGEHGSNRMPEGMPSNPRYPQPPKCGLNFSLQYCRKIERLFPLVHMRWKNEILRAVGVALRSPLLQSQLEDRMHRQWLFGSNSPVASDAAGAINVVLIRHCCLDLEVRVSVVIENHQCFSRLRLFPTNAVVRRSLALLMCNHVSTQVSWLVLNSPVRS
jgi:hypothetical protein